MVKVNRIYIKKLSSNELGYRNGVSKVGQMLYISKSALNFFPELNRGILNHTMNLEIEFPELNAISTFKYVFHNDYYLKLGGSRNEHRIYLSKLTEDYLKPDDIVLIYKTNINKRYSLKKVSLSSNDHYIFLEEMIKKSSLRGNHAFIDIF
jgi:hypothetical protein